MKTKTINLYEYSELSPEAKKKALDNWNEHNDDPLMQSHMINLLKEKLDERGIKYDDSIDVRYSLSYCQGDGFMFLGTFEWKKYTVYISHNNSRYYHSKTASIEIHETDNLGFDIGDDYEPKVYDELETIYHAICKEMEQAGYNHIEWTMSEEYFLDACEANLYTFREDGTIENE